MSAISRLTKVGTLAVLTGSALFVGFGFSTGAAYAAPVEGHYSAISVTHQYQEVQSVRCYEHPCCLINPKTPYGKTCDIAVA
jgi:hypothetical protein